MGVSECNVTAPCCHRAADNNNASIDSVRYVRPCSRSSRDNLNDFARQTIQRCRIDTSQPQRKIEWLILKYPRCLKPLPAIPADVSSGARISIPYYRRKSCVDG